MRGAFKLRLCFLLYYSQERVGEKESVMTSSYQSRMHGSHQKLAVSAASSRDAPLQPKLPPSPPFSFPPLAVWHVGKTAAKWGKTSGAEAGRRSRRVSPVEQQTKTLSLRQLWPW